MNSIKSKEEINALREAQKRLTWIDNVKRKLGYSQEEAEKKWQEIFIKRTA